MTAGGTTRLAAKMATGAATAAPAKSTRLGAQLAQGLRGEEVTLPVLGKVWIELAGHETVNEIEGAVFAEMERLNLRLGTDTALSYEAERVVRTLAAAVRDPDDHSVRFGTVAEWGQLDVDLVNACGQVYGDVRERLDPIGMASLSDEVLQAIRLGLQKKSARILRSCGVANLSLWLLTTADPPASSPTPPSPTGESSSD